jgi:predicted lipoprotein with Yx(FWY)xxD motif
MLNGKALGMLLAGAIMVGGCTTMDSGAPLRYSGGVMVNDAGMTVYTFDKDPMGSGKSVCNGQCAVNWPPLKPGTEESASGDYSIVTRDDGWRQWAYRGKPLYLWIKDQKPGDRTGDGFNKVWHVVPQASGSMRPGY